MMCDACVTGSVHGAQQGRVRAAQAVEREGEAGMMYVRSWG